MVISIVQKAVSLNFLCVLVAVDVCNNHRKKIEKFV